MKRIVTRFLCGLLACCCLLACAGAEGTGENAASEATLTIEGVHSLFTANGSLYAGGWGGLYRFDAQGANPVHIAVNGALSGISKIIADGDTFFAVGGRGNQSVLYSLTLTGNTLGDLREMAAFPMPEGEEAFSSATALVADESAVWALITVNDMDSINGISTLYRVDRAGGEAVKLGAENLTDLCAYKDGFLLARQWDREASYRSDEGVNPELVCVSKADGSISPLCALPSDAFSAPVYDAASDLIYTASPSKLIRLDASLVPETCAYLSLPYINDGAPALLWNGRYFVASWDEHLGFSSAATDPALMPSRVLKLGMSYMDNVTRAFCKAHPEIAVTLIDGVFLTTDRIMENMTAASGETDIYLLYLGYGSYEALRNKGYYVALEQNEAIAQMVGRMYPQLAAACYAADGSLCALPYSASIAGVGYSPSALEKLGMTESDLPKTYGELMELAARWAEDFEDNDDGLTFAGEVYNIRLELMDRMDFAYISRPRAGGEALSFDTPLYRSLLQKLDELSPAMVTLNSPEDERWEGEVFYADGRDAPSLFSFEQEIDPRAYSICDYAALPLVLEAGDDPAFETVEQALLINPYSQNVDIALTYLEYVAQHIDPYSAITMFPDHNDPIEDDYYQNDAAGSDATIADLQKRLLAAEDENKSALEQTLAAELSWREELETRRWSVSPQRIDDYRKLAPYMVLNADNVLANANIIDLRARYSEGTLAADQYVAELERILRLMRLENE